MVLNLSRYSRYVLLLLVVLGCSVLVQGTTTTAAKSRKSKIQLAFGIMTYQREDRSVDETYAEFLRLMVNIYESEDKHLYILHTDIKSDPMLLHAINNDYCAPKANCRHIEPRNIAWGSLSTGEMMLALMRKADTFFHDNRGRVTDGHAWDYFILLGHESFPLTKLSYVENFLASQPRGTNFMNCWAVKGYNFFGQWESNDWRLQQLVFDDFEGSMRDIPDIHRQPPSSFPTFYKSLQHVVVSRDFVRYACYGEETMKLMLFLANVRTADEMILPTILQSNESLAKTVRCDTTLHYSHWIRPGGSWHPEYLDLEHLPVLMQHAGIDALWARKMNLYTSDVLVWAIDKLREQVLSDELISDRLVYFGPSSPTQSPTFAQSDYYSPSSAPTPTSSSTSSEESQADSTINDNANPSAEPSASPGILLNDYVGSMNWIVPVGVKHIRDTFANPQTHPKVKQMLEKMPILHRVMSSASWESLNLHPFAVLKGLDAIRRTKDKIHSKDFVKMYFHGNYSYLVPQGQSIIPYLFEEDIDKSVAASSTSDANSAGDNINSDIASDTSNHDNNNNNNNHDGSDGGHGQPVRRVVRRGLHGGTVRFKPDEIRFTQIMEHGINRDFEDIDVNDSSNSFQIDSKDVNSITMP